MFRPGVRAAAHYLKAVEQVDPGVRKKLSEEVLGKHQFPNGFPDWQGIGLFPSRVTHKPIPGHPLEPQQEKFKKARPFLRALRLWATEYYMWSPFILELLYRTLDLWDKIDREIGEWRSLLRQVEEYQERRSITKEDERGVKAEKRRLGVLESERKGWGWWVDFLASDITIPELETWLRERRSGNRSHRVLYERMESLHVDFVWEPPLNAPPFDLILRGWSPEVETWAAAKERFRETFEEALSAYHAHYAKRLKKGLLGPKPKNWQSTENERESIRRGRPFKWEPVTTKYGDDHFLWLALRQVKGLRPQEIADRSSVGKTVSTVNEAIEGTARLLKLELRPVPLGRPS